MRWTLQTVVKHAQDKGLDLIQVDGIPEGFSYKEPDVTIGDKTHKGRYVLYGPLGEDIIKAETEQDLLNSYNHFKKNV